MRWVHDEGLHLTLKFFGEVGAERLDVIAEALRFAAAGAGPLALRLGRVWERFPAGAVPGCSGSDSRRRRRWSCCRTGSSAAARPSAFRLRARRSSPTSPWAECARASGFPPGGWTTHADGFERVPFVAEQLVLYESVLTTRRPALRVAAHPGSGALMGCLTAPFKLLGCLGLIAALLHRLAIPRPAGAARPAGCSAASVDGKRRLRRAGRARARWSRPTPRSIR